MITYDTHDNETGQQLQITWTDATEIEPTDDLIGRTAGFYPSKRIGALMGVITAVSDMAYTIKVTSFENKTGQREIGKYWLCNKATTAVMLF